MPVVSSQVDGTSLESNKVTRKNCNDKGSPPCRLLSSSDEELSSYLHCWSQNAATDVSNRFTKKSDSRGRSPDTWMRQMGQESLLDIHGKPAPLKMTCRHGSKDTTAITSTSSTKTKNAKQNEAHLGNIFMKPVVIEEDYKYPKFEKTREERKFIEHVICGDG